MVSNVGVLLVHGGEHGSWCWERMRPMLQTPSEVVDLPGRDLRAGEITTLGLDDSIRAVDEAAIASGFDRCIIVSHSMAGIPVMSAARLRPTLASHLVFVSAVLPMPGASCLDGLEWPFRALQRLMLARPSRQHRAIHLLPTFLAKVMWCRGLSDADQQLVLDRRSAEPARIPLQRTPQGDLLPTPSTYIHLAQDRAVPLRLQEKMVRRIGITRTRTLNTVHEAMLSEPVGLAGLLDSIAEEVAAQA